MEDARRFKLLKELGFINPDSELDTVANVQVLKPFSNEQITEAFISHKAQSPYPIKVCDVVDYWKKKSGQTDAQLEQRAAMIYERHFKNPKTGYDHVADKRTVYAFRVAFGTLSEYGSRTNFIDAVDKKDFIKAYVNARPEDYEHVGNVIEGRNHRYTDANSTVVCIGEASKELAKKIYGAGIKDANAIVYKRSQPQLLENQTASKRSPEEAKKIRDLISNYLKQVKVNV